MMILSGLAACMVAVSSSKTIRKLSYECCAGYEPVTDVVPHSRIDLDQKEMEEHLKNYDFTAAKKIYNFGGNSGATALLGVATLAANAEKGATVKQGGNALGVMKSAAAPGGTSIKVTYSSVCKEGGSATKDVSGCFTLGGGSISIGGVIVGAPTSVKNTYRTLAGFSTAAQAKMEGQEFYAVYRAYYNQGAYAHQRVEAALDKTGICSACDQIARVEIAKKTSAYMNVWMYVIREMEDAIIDCQSGCQKCNDDPVHAWDEAAAFYAGSLEGFYGSSENAAGKLLHELADKRCKDFGTCSAGDGQSAVNKAIIGLFRKGQHNLLQGRCVEAIPIKRRIVELMSVPLVQGSLRYAYKVDKLEGGSKEKAEGAAFSAAILPRIAVCNADAAKTIEDNMKIDSPSPMSAGFTAVKQAFESTYTCLGITCDDVGGIIESGTDYFEFAEPCKTSITQSQAAPVPAPSPAETGLPLWVVIVIAAAGCLIAFICGAVAWKRGFNSGKSYGRFDHTNALGVPAEAVGKPNAVNTTMV